MARLIPLLFCFAILVTVRFAVAQNRDRIPVEVWRTGDDGLTVRLAEAIEAAVSANPRFNLSSGGRPGSLLIVIPNHVAWKKLNGKMEVKYAIDFAGVDRRSIGSSQGSCFDDAFSLCARHILADATAVVSRAH